MDQLVTVKGQPVVLDAVFRPIVRWSLLLLGAIVSAVLGWFGQWFWLPIPMVVAHFAFEAIFYVRGDRPVVVRLRGRQLTMTDSKGGHQFDVDLNQAHAASLAVRRGTRGRDQAFIVLHDTERVLVALRLITTHLHWPDHAVPLDDLQPVFGGNAGIVRGLGPITRIVRQTLRDDEGAAARALLERIPEPAWSRTAARVWRGEAPMVDFMGLHQGEPDGLIILEGSRVEVVQHEPARRQQHKIAAHEGGRAERLLELMAGPGEAAQSARLPLVVWQVATGVQLVIPSPHAGRHGDWCDLSDHSLHTHLAEGTLVAWFLLQHQADKQVPSSISLGIRDAMTAMEEPNPQLSRHWERPT